MTPFFNEDLREALRWVFLIFVSILLAGLILAGGIFGCEQNIQHNSRITKVQLRNNAQAALYKLCKKRAEAGVLPPPEVCPK